MQVDSDLPLVHVLEQFQLLIVSFANNYVCYIFVYFLKSCGSAQTGDLVQFCDFRAREPAKVDLKVWST